MTKLLVIKIGYSIYLIILGILIIPKTFCIWPPPYKVTLSYEETFVIFDPIDKAELQDVYEEEMINREDMRNLKVESHDDKYYRIHRSLNNNNNIMKEEIEEPVKKKKVFEEFNPDKEYSAPFKAGLVNDEDDEFINDDVIYFDSGQDDDFRKRKRDEKLNSTNENYDYNKLKNQYDLELHQSETSNDTVNYTNVKEDESIQDSIKTLLKIKKGPKNCTEEETKGIGLGAVECLWIDLNKPKLKNSVIEKIIRIVIIWFAVYLVIAIPLWCQYGWCCCCFRCKFCRPLEQIEEVKQFWAQNPAGTYHDKDGNVVKYEPTLYEKYAQKALEDQLRKL